MSEINNTHLNRSYRNNQAEFDRININDPKKIAPDNSAEYKKTEEKYVPDTGILGRSQIKSAKGSDIDKSIDEAVFLAQHHPDVLVCGGIVFDELYEKFINDGMTPDEAYFAAASGAAEVHAIGVASKK